MPAALLLWNPQKWQLPQGEWERHVVTLAAGDPVAMSWAVSRRRHVDAKTRLFLLRQGAGPRGIVASGWTTSEPWTGEHYADPEMVASYVDVDWDAFVPDPDLPLPVETLLEGVPEVSWNFVREGGFTVEDAALEKVEALWAAHPRAAAGGLADRAKSRAVAAHGQGRVVDAVVRRRIEDHAQAMVMGSFEDAGWHVEDTRNGNPYDAVARRGEEIVYLEAKGTTGDGVSVFVTAGEVRWATEHPGACRMGVVSGIELDDDGRVVSGSGTLAMLPWDPAAGAPEALQYRWTPGASAVGER